MAKQYLQPSLKIADGSLTEVRSLGQLLLGGAERAGGGLHSAGCRQGSDRGGVVQLLPTATGATQDPRYWEFVEQFPMTVTGKIQKFRIREIETEQRGLEKVAKLETA